jgi:hypothetical protein
MGKNRYTISEMKILKSKIEPYGDKCNSLAYENRLLIFKLIA